MKSFTEREPHVLGALLIAVIATGTAFALLLNGGVFKHQFTMYGDFTDSAGLTKGALVRVAGVQVGQVQSVKAHGKYVRITMKVDKGAKLPRDSRASIAVATLLGTKYVKLVAGGNWSRLLHSGSVIGPQHTSTPVELTDLQNIATPLLRETDTKAINDLMAQLSDVTAGKQTDLRRILAGFDRLTTVVDERQGDARTLIDSARTLSQTLASRDQDLVATVDDLTTVVDTLVQRRAELANLLATTAEASQKLATLVHTNRPQLDGELDELHSDLQIISRHQMDLAQSLQLLGAAFKGFSSIGYSGPNDYPNYSWVNAFGQLVGPVDQDALYGSCGLLDKALDLLLGPDPVETKGGCTAATGPMVGIATGQHVGSPVPAGGVDPSGSLVSALTPVLS